MNIDWFTIAAQAVNFLVLVWLMRRFLYKPILHAIDERENQIAAKLANAETLQATAKKERGEFEQKNSDFDRQRETLLRTATDGAEAERQKLIEQARHDARAVQSHEQEALRNEQLSLRQALALRVQQEVFAISRKALADLAGATLEARMCEVFTRRLRQVDGTEKETFAKALATMSGSALVRSASDLPDAQRLAIRHVLNETFAADIKLEFETGASLICGIEVVASGRKMSWSIEEYLTSLEQGITDLLEENDNPEVSAETRTNNQ